MDAERLQFHEMGLDDRLLKVTHSLTPPVNFKWILDNISELLNEQLESKNRSEAEENST